RDMPPPPSSRSSRKAAPRWSCNWVRRSNFDPEDMGMMRKLRGAVPRRQHRSVPFHASELPDPGPHAGDYRLELRVGIAPLIDQGGILPDRGGGVAARFVDLAQSLPDQ